MSACVRERDGGRETEYLQMFINIKVKVFI